MTGTPLPRPPIDAAVPNQRGKIILLVLFIGGMGVCLIVGVIVMFLMLSSPEPVEPRIAPNSTTAPPLTTGSQAVAPTPVAAPEEEKEAQAVFDEAEKIARASVDRPDLAIAKFRDVRVRFPQTSWARKAAQRTAELEESIRAIFEAEFEGVRREARTHCAAGRFRQAVETLQKYIQSSSKELLKKRADAEIAAIENDARIKFNAAVRHAQTLARQGKHDEAVALFRSLEPQAPVGMQQACGIEMDSIQESRASFAEKKTRDTERAAEDKLIEAGQSLLDACKKRKFDDALKILDGLPLSQGAQDEREVVAAAAAFWDAFLKGYRARVGQDVSLRLPDDKRATGKLGRVEVDRAVIGLVEIEHDSLHADQLILLAFDVLPAGEPASYVKTAMYFFVLGKRDVARLYLATAKELGANIEGNERVWRAGAIRAAQVIKK